MKLELEKAVNNCSLISTRAFSDMKNMATALNFADHFQWHDLKTVLIISPDTIAKEESDFYKKAARFLKERGVSRIIATGEGYVENRNVFDFERSFFETIHELIDGLETLHFQDETILLIGESSEAFERLRRKLLASVHETVLEVNINALLHNLAYYRSLLKPKTKIMAVVKANSYGAGSVEVASLLQARGVDYFAVAYADEGIELRKGGVTLPVMVMNPGINSIEHLIEYTLEPELYSFSMLKNFSRVAEEVAGSNEPYPVHLKLDTGMYRLGFKEKEVDELIVFLRQARNIKVQSILSHLVASEEAEKDNFTRSQYQRFREMSEKIMASLAYPVMRHMTNSAGIIRFPEGHFDMVRTGIGLYGMTDTVAEQQYVENFTTLKSVISQIKDVPSGDTVGYNRIGKTSRDSRVATVPIGYADGYSILMSRGAGKMLVQGKYAPVIGQVCMDMTILDITDIPEAKEGDEVIVYGKNYPVYQAAADANINPYELLTRVGQRIRKRYLYEV